MSPIRRSLARLLGSLILLLLTACGSAIPTVAVAPQPAPTAEPPQPTPTAKIDDLLALSDEFDDPGTLRNWQDHATVEGWPSWIEAVDVDTTSSGHLFLIPLSSGWYQDYRGVFLFKTVTGDFDVTTRVQATGKQSELPKRAFSLSGLMVRQPRQVTMETWTPGHENWLFITTGFGDHHPQRAGKPQIETKTTVNSRSTLVLRLSRSGWVDLRAVRVGQTFLMLYRFPGDAWQISQIYQRPDLPPTLQVGLNAYSSNGTSGDVVAFNRTARPEPGDLIVRSDYIRFRRPSLSQDLKAELAAQELKREQWLQLIGE